jgi:serine/threonine protein kinase
MASGPWSAVTNKPFLVEAPLWWRWQWLAATIGTVLALVAIWFGWHRRMAVQTGTALPDLTEWRMTALEPDVYDIVGKALDERYEVGAVIARGGFGAVLDAYDRDQQRRCAIKVFRQDEATDAHVNRALLREVTALERIHHHNVVQIYGHGVTPGGAPYLVMEFVEGSTLRRVLEAGALPPERIANLLLQAGDALGHLHAERIYHRDVKPENIMLRPGPSGRSDLVLIDFSIAIIKDPNVTIHGLSKAAGSVEYMAPEQLIGYVDEASDIYSLARIVIEMMTGKRVALLLPDASLDLPLRARELLQKLPLNLSDASLDVLSTALDYHPARRPRDAAQFARRIAADLTSSAIGAQS